jgi:hypothetical protein
MEFKHCECHWGDQVEEMLLPKEINCEKHYLYFISSNGTILSLVSI